MHCEAEHHAYAVLPATPEISLSVTQKTVLNIRFLNFSIQYGNHCAHASKQITQRPNPASCKLQDTTTHNHGKRRQCFTARYP